MADTYLFGTANDVVTGQKDVRNIVIPDYEAEIEEKDTDLAVDLDGMESEVSDDE